MGFGTRNVLVLAACMQSRWGSKAWLHLLPAEAFLWSVCTYSLCLPGFIPQTQTSCSMDMWMCGSLFLHLVFYNFFTGLFSGFFRMAWTSWSTCWLCSKAFLRASSVLSSRWRRRVTSESRAEGSSIEYRRWSGEDRSRPWKNRTS